MLKLLIVCVLYGVAAPAQDTGYPAGFMADCPGMNKTTTFSDSTKKSLSVVVLWPKSSFFSRGEQRCRLVGGASCASQYLNFKKRKTKVLISGYMDASFSPVVRSLVSVYLEQKYNVIVLEIFPILVRTYPLAARVTKPLGDLLGDFLVDLTLRGLPPNQLELVGGSLGAHIASYAAARYLERTGRKPARLTGLDPAGPCFRNLPPTQRFNKRAAVRVDALHTNIDGFGIADAVAQIDFYANGGEFQPSMAGDFILPCFIVCSHVRAAFYWYLANRNQDKFLAVKCDSVGKARHGDCYDYPIESNVLGPKTNFTKPGIYYLPTKEIMPYYIGEEGLKKRFLGANAYLEKTAPDENIVV